MLGKLLKYELKRSARKFFPLVVGYMIVALIFSLMLRYGESVKSPNFLMIFIVVSIAYGIAVGALFTVGFTISLTNFHKTLFTDEGYLMLTIPVKPYYHIFTKFISSVIWSAASMIVFVLSLLLIDPTEYLDSVGDFINALGNGFAEEPLTSFLICLYTLTLFAGLQIFLYFVISLSNCFKHKVLVGFAIIFACNMLSSMISNLAGDLSLWNMLFMPTSRLPDIEVAFNLRLVFMTMYQFAYILAYFLLTNFIITRKHNLQ